MLASYGEKALTEDQIELILAEELRAARKDAADDDDLRDDDREENDQSEEASATNDYDYLEDYEQQMTQLSRQRESEILDYLQEDVTLDINLVEPCQVIEEPKVVEDVKMNGFFSKIWKSFKNASL